VSEEDLELVRRVYEKWARGDFSMGEFLHADVEFEMVDWPEGSSARGINDMTRAWLGALSAWEDFRVEPREFISAGRHLLVLNRINGRGRGSGIEMSADTASLWTIEAGKVVRLALYWDVAKAFEAAGLER
jgi:ketosteroid isomerase-like protein